MVQQEQINAQIRATNSTTSQLSLQSSAAEKIRVTPNYVGYYYISDTDGVSIDTHEHDNVNERLVGHVSDPNNLEMYSDNNYARFYTAGWDLVDTVEAKL
jgi:hypothetical protein